MLTKIAEIIMLIFVSIILLIIMFYGFFGLISKNISAILIGLIYLFVASNIIYKMCIQPIFNVVNLLLTKQRKEK
jgi:hypothetical protein